MKGKDGVSRKVPGTGDNSDVNLSALERRLVHAPGPTTLVNLTSRTVRQCLMPQEFAIFRNDFYREYLVFF